MGLGRTRRVVCSMEISIGNSYTVNIMSTDIIGYIAGILIITSLIPQIIKSWRTKSTTDLSLTRYLIYVTGVVMWLIYGIVITNNPMIIMNTINLTLALSVVYLKLKYK